MYKILVFRTLLDYLFSCVCVFGGGGSKPIFAKKPPPGEISIMHMYVLYKDNWDRLGDLDKKNCS